MIPDAAVFGFGIARLSGPVAFFALLGIVRAPVAAIFTFESCLFLVVKNKVVSGCEQEVAVSDVSCTGRVRTKKTRRKIETSAGAT